MSNDSISLTLGIDYDSIGEDTVLLVNPDGDETSQQQVIVRKANSILTADGEYVTAYFVETLENTFNYSFIIGDGEIVEIVEEEDKDEGEEELEWDEASGWNGEEEGESE